MPRWPARDDDALLAAYLAGASVAEVAQQFGISTSTVYNRLQRAQIPVRPTVRLRTAPVSQAELAAIRAAYREGETMSALAARFGIARQGVSRALRADGVIRQSRRSRRTRTS